MGNNSVPKFIFRLSRFPVYRGSVLVRFYCIYVIKTNLMYYLSSVYFVSKPLQVSGISVAHHQEVYCIYTVIVTCCAIQLILCWPAPSQPGQQTVNWKAQHVPVAVYRVSQEERTKLREDVPYVKLYRYNPKHLYRKLNGYGDNGKRSLKLWQLLHILSILKLAGICGFCNVNICT